MMMMKVSWSKPKVCGYGNKYTWKETQKKWEEILVVILL